jgi:hypothetical protein
MITSHTPCTHTCKELCTALEVATLQEKEAILQYATFRDECTYPDVKIMLNELILLRQKSIQLLEETKSLLRSKFEVLDQVRQGFDM